MRLFTAIYPPAEAIGHLAAQVAGLRVTAAATAGTNVRLVDPARVHLTLAFLGDVDPARVAAVRQALADTASTARDRRAGSTGGDRCVGSTGGDRCVGSTGGDRCVGSTGGDRCVGSTGGDRCVGSTGGDRRAVLRLGGGGRFGWGRSTVLWVDVRGDVDRLLTLAGDVRAALATVGIPGDDRPFRPHLTIARPGDRMPHADVEADLAALDGYLGPPWPADELVLVQSRPGPPASYHRLAAWPL
ncbi:2'-5' RNA ligase family protein [Micromonospora sp. FIMYZ51]|uniref:2'-5' RNA ligase family protein n=1 Tax=Micromonospora sp. FIMYZ51 TaxID=3051832 RepID=UPI00311D84E6